MQVDEIVVAIDGGKTAADFKDAAKKEPYYVYILEERRTLLVHPSLEGKSLKEAAAPAYEAVSQSHPGRHLGDVRMERRGEKRLCQKNKER